MNAMLIYETDNQHTKSSRVLIGVYTKREKLFRKLESLCKKNIKKYSNESKDEQEIILVDSLEQLKRYNQTQNLYGLEYYIEPIELNKIF